MGADTIDDEIAEASDLAAESRLPHTQAMPLSPRAKRESSDSPDTPLEPPAEAEGGPRPGDPAPGGWTASATPAPPQDPADAQRSSWSLGERYRIEELLGEGGMGRVYRAHDTQLDRTVAIKVLVSSAGASAAAFGREAQLQARVEHPNVAKVYETGQADGRRYIVMQFIPGRPLGELAERMSLEEKVRAIQRVAEGIHEAHRLGLVHGDIKPSNLLAVAEANGAWHPYVLDFGIAREMATAGASPRVVAGTPAYMAPEQAQGETLDRRTDVYGLGVTLYRLLSGKLPYARRGSSAGTLEQALQGEPAPLRQLAPQVPPDLEAIVMKCLERAPARRYATARALADDLVLFLDGEPVSARSQTVLYRLTKKARKNRALVAISTAALLGILVATGWAVRERLETARRTALAERFGREEERFEWILRAAHELPLHDTSRERGAVRAAITRLGSEVEGLPAALRAPGDAALGRGLLALGDEAPARTHLERAWRAGHRAPEVAYALGLTLVHAYQDALARARLARDEAERHLALESANHRLRDPARTYLRSSRGDELVASEYLEGLLAYLAGNPLAALQRSRAAIARLPWFYDALLLEAQAWRALADQVRDEPARAAALVNAEAALERAVRLGASDQRNYLDLCETEIERVQNAILGSGLGVPELGERATRACGAALLADPGSASALSRRAEALTLLAGFELEHGADPEPHLREAEASAREAIRRRGDQAEPHRALAAVWSLRAHALRLHGGDVRRALGPAIASLDQALQREPEDWQGLQSLGSAYAQRAMQEFEHGEDPRRSFAASVAALRKAAALQPRLCTTYFNLGRTYGDWGEYLTNLGKDPTEVHENAIAAYRRAIAIKPDYAQAYNSLGAVLNIRGGAPRRGADPMAILSEAEAAFKKSIAIQPSYANPRFNLGVCYRQMAYLDDGSGRNPWPHLNQAIAAFQEGLRLNPKIFFAYIEMGRIYVVGGNYEVNHHRSPEDAVREGVRLADKSLEMQPDDFMALKERGESRLVAASWAVDQHREPEPALGLALADFERAAKVNTNDFGVYELLAQVRRLQAQSRHAAGLPVDAQVDLGLQQVAAGRKIAGEDEPGLLDEEGQLHLLRAQAARQPAERAAAARRAVAAFEACTRLRPAAAPQVAENLLEARRLAGGPAQPAAGAPPGKP